LFLVKEQYRLVEVLETSGRVPKDAEQYRYSSDA